MIHNGKNISEVIWLNIFMKKVEILEMAEIRLFIPCLVFQGTRRNCVWGAEVMVPESGLEFRESACWFPKRLVLGIQHPFPGSQSLVQRRICKNIRYT